MKNILLILAVCLTASFASAQESSAGIGSGEGQEDEKSRENFYRRYELGASAGTFLPNDIFGVRDQYSGWAFRFGHPLRIWRVEYSGTVINAKGVQFYTASASIGGDLDFYDIDFMTYVGMDLHYYSGRTAIRHVPFETVQGAHVGLSPIIQAGDGVLARADFKMNFSPGVSLYVGVGIALWFGESDKDDQNKASLLNDRGAYASVQ